ncbi:MAG: hypothetical protein IJO96_06980 [Oscillospiraceae bacterium]|nr:hypothetical protein [Oscillospiraceae bacterium]
MENNHASILAKELNVREDHVQNVIKLIDEGNTIPFIARYRKELTGTMDDQLLRQLADRLDYLRGLDKRREEIISSIDAQGKLTDELRADIEKAVTLASLEDLYRPYKQKRRTRATVAREKGLEPLAEMIFAQDIMRGSIDEIAADFIDAEKGVESAEDAISGACDIIAENISDDAAIRSALRELFMKRALVVSKAATEEDSVYRTYYDFSEAVSKIQSHRVLAINRGEKEEFLKVAVEIDNNEALNVIRRAALKPGSITSGLVNTAIEDAWERLIYPSVEREIRSTLTDSANEQAIKMFGLNLEPLLMQPPLRNRVTLGFDPAYRTGCKIAVVDATGKVLDTTVVFI